MKPSELVNRWIEDNFDATAVTVEPFPLMPHGRLITDRDGQTMVVYFDFLNNEVKTMLPREEGQK